MIEVRLFFLGAVLMFSSCTDDRNVREVSGDLIYLPLGSPNTSIIYSNRKKLFDQLMAISRDPTFEDFLKSNGVQFSDGDGATYNSKKGIIAVTGSSEFKRGVQGCLTLLDEAGVREYESYIGSLEE